MRFKKLLSIVLLLLIIFSFTVFSQEEKTTIKRSLKIHHKVIGKGTPVVMLHGFGVDHNQMIGCMEPIFENTKGWRRIYIDLPGMGKSEGKAWLANTEKLYQMVSRLINQLTKREKFAIVAHSYGAYLAQALVHDYSTEILGVLLITPVTYPEVDERVLPIKKVITRDEKFLKTLSAKERKVFESLAVLQEKRVWERFKTDILPGINSGNDSFLLRLKGTGYKFPYDLMKVTMAYSNPFYILAGKQDHLVGYRDPYRLIDLFAQANIFIFNGAGPLLQIEQEEYFNYITKRWLDEIRKENPVQEVSKMPEDEVKDISESSD